MEDEVLYFGTNEDGSVRVLGSWVCVEADMNNWIRRANGLWRKVKKRLKSLRQTKKWQGRVIDCHARVWYKRDIGKLQSWIDKCYRYVWSNRKAKSKRQMEAREVNMHDARMCLCAKSVRWKVEYRVLERMGRIVRMQNNRITSVMVIGWYEGLEAKAKTMGCKRKTVLYWNKI